MQFFILKWIIEERKIQYYKRDFTNTYRKLIHSELTFRLSAIEFDLLDNNIRENVNLLIHKKYLKQRNKLQNLLHHNNNCLTYNRSYHNNNTSNNNRFSDHNFYQRFINMSNVEFTNDEIKLIEKGFKFNLVSNNQIKNLELLGVE